MRSVISYHSLFYHWKKNSRLLLYGYDLANENVVYTMWMPLIRVLLKFGLIGHCSLESLWLSQIKLLHKWMALLCLLDPRSSPSVGTSWLMLRQQGVLTADKLPISKSPTSVLFLISYP
jgi:hypothetical protein